MKQEIQALSVAHLAGMQGTEAIISQLRQGKMYMCPCDDGRGTGTSTDANTGKKYLCPACKGDGYTTTPKKRVQVALAKGVLGWDIVDAINS
jgi:DnaJ-class molecular chaperone